MTTYRVTTFRYGNRNGNQGGERGGNTVRDFDNEYDANRWAKDQVEVGPADTAAVQKIEVTR